MERPRIINPEDAAAAAIIMLAERESISYNEAMVRFMHSETFHRMIKKEYEDEPDPREVLEEFLDETGSSRCGSELKKVGQSTLRITAEYPFRDSSPLSSARQSILRNQGGVMDHTMSSASEPEQSRTIPASRYRVQHRNIRYLTAAGQPESWPGNA